MTWSEWSIKLQKKTETFLTWRKRRHLAKKEKQKRKNPVLDWADAIISAVFIVLLINQFLLQAYMIPSQSMVPTLKISDRIFVNKLIYGPELLPGLFKINSPRELRRGEVIIFENPSYIPMGPVKDILQRVIYMITLSLVDIDRDEYGRPKHHFLIKRAVATAGDRIRMNKGEVEIMLPGQNYWHTETEIKELYNLQYTRRRIFSPEQYVYFEKAGEALALLDAGLTLSNDQKNAVNRYFYITDSTAGPSSWSQKELIDNASVQESRYAALYALKPYSRLFREQWSILERGWYIPEGRIFPMGDNRDDSRDARFFGPVRLEKVLGRALFKYWPLSRLGIIR